MAMTTLHIAPSILSADFSQLAKEIAQLEARGADLLQTDIMDGHFVPSFTVGPPTIKALRKSRAEILVSRSAIFSNGSYAASIQAMRNAGRGMAV